MISAFKRFLRRSKPQRAGKSTRQELRNIVFQKIGRGGDGTDRSNAFISGFAWWCAKIAELPRSHIEPVQYIKYGVGGKYDWHQDDGNDRHREFFDESGGQRLWSFVLYLNDGFKGGHTEFSEYGSVIPSAGFCLYWKNNGPSTRHRCTPISHGVKHILATWARERCYE